FELYTTMLEQAVRELKGEDQVERPSVQLNLGISLRIDANYIEEENQRLRMYKRIASAENESAIEDIVAEMQDRYGAMPEPVQLLVTAGRLRLLCEQTGVAQMDRKGQMVSVRFTETANIDPEKLMQLVARNAKRGAQFTPQGVLRFPVKATVPAEVLAELRRLIEALATPLPMSPSAKEVGSQPVR
ncbi:MAG: TRCF domain-containing protein, partial [Acidobacteriaceae bacterium]